MIIYNDNALLYDPERSAQSTQQHFFAVVAHESRTSGCGTLVTMACGTTSGQ